MENDLKIDLEQLEKIIMAIRQKKYMIMDIYEKRIQKILYIPESNQNDTEKEKFETLFSRFDDDMTNLEETVVNKIIPIYQSLPHDLKVIFNNQFANEMQNLLDTDN